MSVPKKADIDRRTFLKTVGAGGAAAAGLGAGPDALPSSTGETEAFGPLVPLGVAAVGIAGAYYAGKQDANTPEIDTNDVLEDQVYNIATSVADGREPFEKEMRSNFIDRSNDRTPYANAAWQEIRAAVAKAVVNGKSQSEAEAAAVEALDRQTSRSILNIIERWNAAVKGLMPALVIDLNNSVGVFNITGASEIDTIGSAPSASAIQSPGTWTGINAGQLDNSEYAVFQSAEFTLPAPVSDIDGRDAKPTKYGIVENVTESGSDDKLLINPGHFTPSGVDLTILEATHSSLSTRAILSGQLYNDVAASIKTAYDNISSKLSTYVSNLVGALDQGAIDPADIYSPSDIVNEFSQTDQDARLAAELMAVGASVPDKVGYRAKISHPGLQKDPLWCHLYPMFNVDNPPAIEPNTTLTATEYDIAYIGYDSAVDGSFTTEILSSSSGDLAILDLDGVTNQEEVSSTDDSPIKDSGDVLLGPNSSVPAPLQNPADYSDHVVRVNATANGTTAPVTSVTKNTQGDTQDVWLNGTSLTTSDEINNIEVMKSVGYDQPIDYVSDETTVNSTEVQNLIDEQSQTIEELKETLDPEDNPIGGGGPLLDFGLPTLPGMGLGGTAVVTGLGLLGLGQLTS